MLQLIASDKFTAELTVERKNGGAVDQIVQLMAVWATHSAYAVCFGGF